MQRFGGEENVDWQWWHFHLVGLECARFWWVNNALWVAKIFPQPGTSHFVTWMSLCTGMEDWVRCRLLESSLLRRSEILMRLKSDIFSGKFLLTCFENRRFRVLTEKSGEVLNECNEPSGKIIYFTTLLFLISSGFRYVDINAKGEEFFSCVWLISRLYFHALETQTIVQVQCLIYEMPQFQQYFNGVDVNYLWLLSTRILDRYLVHFDSAFIQPGVTVTVLFIFVR